MNYKSLLDENIDYDKLIQFGFVKEKDKYTYISPLSNKDLYLKIIITKDDLSVSVYDYNFNDEYIPFKIQRGEYSNKIVNEVNEIFYSLKKFVIKENDLINKIKKYTLNKYMTIPEYPWKDTLDAATFKVKNKWYMLLMSIKATSLGLNSNEIINIINIKLDPDKIIKIVDNKHFFKAYHMNKKYWLTILLNSTLDEKILFSLIDESYNIVNNS